MSVRCSGLVGLIAGHKFHPIILSNANCTSEVVVGLYCERCGASATVGDDDDGDDDDEEEFLPTPEGDELRTRR